MYRGVTKHHNQGPRGGRRRENNGKWEARIGRVDGGKYKYLGTFETEQEAADAYDRAVIAYRGSQVIIVLMDQRAPFKHESCAAGLSFVCMAA